MAFDPRLGVASLLSLGLMLGLCPTSARAQAQGARSASTARLASTASSASPDSSASSASSTSSARSARTASSASTASPANPASSTHADSTATFDYVVQKGDTCISIAKRELGASKSYRVIHEFNPSLGKSPHKLAPGQVLKLPRPEHPDAEITATKREVQAQEGRRGQWISAQPGLPMFRGWRVQTLRESFADLRFVDTSTLSMSPNTLVIIYGESARASGRSARAQLTKGSLRARLSELGGKQKRLELVTPSSKASFRGGETLIEVAPTGLSRIENHGEGQAKVSDPSGKHQVPLPKATGTKVLKGKRPSPAQALPPTPSWEGIGRTSLAIGGQGAQAKGTWQPVPEAVAYRLELRKLSKDNTQETINVYEVDASTRSYHIKSLDPGRYAVTVASIDDEDFTSIPSSAQILSIKSMGAKINDKALPLGSKPGSGLKLPYGAKLELPKDARCLSPTLALGDPRGLINPGEHELHCLDQSGNPMEPMQLTVLAAPKAPSSATMHLVRPTDRHASSPHDPYRHVFDLGLGASLWTLQPLGSPQGPPQHTTFVDLALRYGAKPWLQLELDQRLSLPHEYQRQRMVFLGYTGGVNFIYPKWRIQPQLGLQGGVLKRLATAQPANWLWGAHLGAQVRVYGGLALALRASVIRMQQFQNRRGYGSLRGALMASYSFSALGKRAR